VNWVRARNDEQIEQRIREIVDATARLYEENRFEDITFAMIAKEANFTRSNLYRYFETKEEIFLELIKFDIIHWRENIVKTFANYQFTSAQTFTTVWVDLALQNKRMIKLFAIVYTLLEENSSLKALTGFKQTIGMELVLVAEFLSNILPFSSTQNAAEFLQMQTSLTIGAYPLIDLTPKQKTAMDNVGMISDAAYAKELLIKSIAYLLEGFLVP
jgi:AcrR family transcriptional regulator